MNNDDISHFSTIPASFAIKSNVYFLTHQYLIINNSQSQRALSVSVRNCGLLPSDTHHLRVVQVEGEDRVFDHLAVKVLRLHLHQVPLALGSRRA